MDGGNFMQLVKIEETNKINLETHLIIKVDNELYAVINEEA